MQLINKWQPTEVNVRSFHVTISQNQRKRRGSLKEIPPTYNSITIEKSIIAFSEKAKIVRFNILVILIVMIVVATINMVKSPLLVYFRAHQMIGILKNGICNKVECQPKFPLQRLLFNRPSVLF